MSHAGTVETSANPPLMKHRILLDSIAWESTISNAAEKMLQSFHQPDLFYWLISQDNKGMSIKVKHA